MKQVRLFIDGAFVDGSAERFPDVDPARGEICAEVAHANASDVDRAVQAAKGALRGPWGKLAARERADLLDKIANRIDERREEFLRAEIEENEDEVRRLGSQAVEQQTQVDVARTEMARVRQADGGAVEVPATRKRKGRR